MANPFEVGGILGALAPGLSPMVNPLALTGLSMTNPTAAMQMAQRGQLLYQSMVQQAQQQEMQRRQMALAREKFEWEKAKPAAMTALQKNLVAAGLSPGTPEYGQAVMDYLQKSSGTTVNVGQLTPDQARKVAISESTIGQLNRLDDLLSGEDAVDLSGVSGKWAEFQTGTGWGPALVREVFGNVDDRTTEAVQLARQVELAAGEALKSGSLSDKDIEQVQAALGLIGGPDTAGAVRRLRDILSKQEYRARQLSGRANQPEPMGGAGPQPGGSIRVISIRRKD